MRATISSYASPPVDAALAELDSALSEYAYVQGATAGLAAAERKVEKRGLKEAFVDAVGDLFDATREEQRAQADKALHRVLDALSALQERMKEDVQQAAE